MVVEITDGDHGALVIADVPSFVEPRLRVELVDDSESHKWPDRNETHDYPGAHEHQRNKQRGWLFIVLEHFVEFLKKVEVPTDFEVHFADDAPDFLDWLADGARLLYFREFVLHSGLLFGLL